MAHSWVEERWGKMMLRMMLLMQDLFILMSFYKSQDSIILWCQWGCQRSAINYGAATAIPSATVAIWTMELLLQAHQKLSTLCASVGICNTWIRSIMLLCVDACESKYQWMLKLKPWDFAFLTSLQRFIAPSGAEWPQARAAAPKGTVQLYKKWMRRRALLHQWLMRI